MKTFLLSSALCTGLILALPDALNAHGGTYRGPGDVVPPHPGQGGGRPTGPRGPGGPGGPGNPGPVTPGPNAPGVPTPGPGTGSGGPGGGPGGGPITSGPSLDVDLTTWEFWWEFNKDPLLNLKSAIHADETTTNSDLFYMGQGAQRLGRDTRKPTEVEITQTIVPALIRALESTDDRDITTSCMVALAKTGIGSAHIDLVATLTPRLRERDQEVRETAALALGISALPEAMTPLTDLALDTGSGRELVGGHPVDPRTRTFAAYGISLIAHAAENVVLKRRALDALRRLLEVDSIADRNLPVAVVSAIGLLRPGAIDESHAQLLNECLDTLDAFWERDLGVGEQLIQAHVPTAIAKLFEGVDTSADEKLSHRLAGYKRAWLDELGGKSTRKNPVVTQSVIVALGRTTKPLSTDGSTPPLDVEISARLRTYVAEGRDQQAQHFALMALGQIGGDGNRDELLDVLRTGNRAFKKPWAALSLGVLAFRDAPKSHDRDSFDDTIGEALLRELREMKNPSTIGALAIALGLTHHTPGAELLRELLEDKKSQDELAGHLCVGLALMGNQRAQPMIHELVATSSRRPVRLQQAAIALGKLGDKTAVDLLLERLEDDDQNLAKFSSIAAALGFIGDRRSITPLTQRLFDEGLTPLTRAFAAVALGGVADKGLLPWNSRFAVNMNYRAAVETLTNQVDGILDIL